MMKLSDREWKEFRLNDKYFLLYSSINSTDFSKINILGDKYYPFITRSQNNNGIAHFVPRQSKELNSNNVITIGLDTQTIFYQQHPFYTGQNIQIFDLVNFKLNKYIALFIIPLIEKQLKHLNWGGNGATLGRLLKKKILLPINSDGKPDYDFMEQYTKEKYSNLKSQIKEKQKHEITDWRRLDEVEWEPFKAADIFNKIQRGKRLTKSDQVSGEKPYISSSGIYNGLDNFISNTSNVRIFNNCLTIANSGSVGSAFYHPYRFIASDHVTHFKNKDLSKYSYLFIANMMSRFSEKYSFNREINDFRIKRERILLPTKNNKPDYKFMEQYMKRKENEVLERI
ncbi:restriction endonuclease subunit S [Staphylococcus borealis]|uniref:restriction endonuclease subunit S n=1 Tax=Staphylococcus borealis TaxID=2742203 RepID=UPI002DBC1A46|nr:restriction endonuclease subunit S [Staphylococcus borealis]MEB7365389.1 restriction endonuclease subunit S [Staphylococcus borealis]